MVFSVPALWGAASEKPGRLRPPVERDTDREATIFKMFSPGLKGASSLCFGKDLYQLQCFPRNPFHYQQGDEEYREDPGIVQGGIGVGLSLIHI